MPQVKTMLASELGDGEVRQVPLDGQDPVALYRLDGELYATADVCTHSHAFLSEGVVEGGDIVCPFHEGTFDIRTGEATGLPCEVALRTYPVRVGDDGYVYIEIS
jgi:p-cumate 2,3-dioxygenase ferredoxin subunit